MSERIADLFRVEEQALTVRLAHQVEVRFRAVRSGSEYISLGAKSTQFAEMLQSERCPAEWKPFVPANPKISEQVFWVFTLQEEWLVGGEARGKQSQRDLLEMARDGGAVIPYLYGKLVEYASRIAAQQEQEELDSLMGH